MKIFKIRVGSLIIRYLPIMHLLLLAQESTFTMSISGSQWAKCREIQLLSESALRIILGRAGANLEVCIMANLNIVLITALGCKPNWQEHSLDTARTATRNGFFMWVYQCDWDAWSRPRDLRFNKLGIWPNWAVYTRLLRSWGLFEK